MAADFRLRQIAFVSDDCERVARDIERVFGAVVAYRDPLIIHYGLRNVVIPIGRDFIEVVEPVAPDASAGRYLARRGGEGGYMVILQSADAEAHRLRLEAQDAPVVDVLESERHLATHFHPRAFGGVLASIDSSPGVANWRDADSDWDPAGPHWQAAKAGDAIGIADVTIQGADPHAVAAAWSQMLDAPIAPGGGIELLNGAVVRFAPPQDAFGSGIAGLAIAVRDPAASLDRARDAYLPVTGDVVVLCGTPVRIVPA